MLWFLNTLRQQQTPANTPDDIKTMSSRETRASDYTIFTLSEQIAGTINLLNESVAAFPWHKLALTDRYPLHRQYIPAQDRSMMPALHC